MMFINQIHHTLKPRLNLMEVELLKDIREELRELRLLYKELVEKLISVEEPTKEKREAIEEKDEIVNEKELMEA